MPSRFMRIRQDLIKFIWLIAISLAIGLGRAFAETAWLTCENERKDIASIGVTFADRTRLRDFIVQRGGATPMAAAAVPGTGQAQALMEGTHAHSSARTPASCSLALS